MELNDNIMKKYKIAEDSSTSTVSTVCQCQATIQIPVLQIIFYHIIQVCVVSVCCPLLF